MLQNKKNIFIAIGFTAVILIISVYFLKSTSKQIISIDNQVSKKSQNGINYSLNEIQSKVLNDCVAEICPQLDYYLTKSNQKLPYFSFHSKSDNQKSILIYLHGAGGGFEQGMQNDNYKNSFNRLKELVAKENDFLYFTPEVSSLGDSGVSDLIDFINYLKTKYPEKPIYLAGASAGGRLASEVIKTDSKYINGAILICPAVSDSFASEEFPNNTKFNIYITSGSKDEVVPLKTVISIKDGLSRSGYNVALKVIENGDHNTPLEVIKWDDALNFVRGAD